MVTMSQKEFQQVKVMENAAGGRLRVGRIVGMRLASMVLPDPGGPIIRMV
jgi:hypothetical protein